MNYYSNIKKTKVKGRHKKMIKMSIICGAFNKFPYIFLYRHLELSQTLANSVCYCYTSYEMTDQFL